MNIKQTAAVLAKIQIIDNRQVTDATVLAWHELIGDLEYQDALAAVAEHFRESSEYLKPRHVRSNAKRILWVRQDRQLELGFEAIRAAIGGRAYYVEGFAIELGRAIETGGGLAAVVERINHTLAKYALDERMQVPTGALPTRQAAVAERLRDEGKETA